MARPLLKEGQTLTRSQYFIRLIFPPNITPYPRVTCMRSKKKLAVIILILLLAGAVAAWFFLRSKPATNTLTLYGNIDIRQVQLAFHDAGRIQTLLVQEGDAVHPGQLLAILDPARFQDALLRAQATRAAQQETLNKLLAGTRPEEIAQARARLQAAQAVVANARITAQRQTALAAQRYVSQQSADNASRALKSALAELQVAQEGLALALRGPRQEDIAAARQKLRADGAALALAQRELDDTKLYAPASGVIQDRILEPGDMTSAATPAFSLALDNPVWVRAYLPEPELGKVRLGMSARIYSDSFPHQSFAGWVGFISPTAEFTPKAVETTELRTQLVYRVRIYACNPQHQLRLGMPVTVQIPLQDNVPKERGAAVCQ